MNREIKFRGKRLDNGEWVYGDLLHLVDGVYISNDNGNNMAQVDPDTVGQYTGLKDKNGKLIYEGDRVYIDCEDATAIIKWSDDLARFTIHFEDEAVFVDFDDYYSKELEVIGNIYENPELLKDGE